MWSGVTRVDATPTRHTRDETTRDARDTRGLREPVEEKSQHGPVPRATCHPSRPYNTSVGRFRIPTVNGLDMKNPIRHISVRRIVHRVRCPLGQSHVFAPPRFIRERLPSYGARAPSIAKSTYKSYLVFRSFRLSSSLRTSALLAKPLAWRSRFAGPLCWHTAIPSKGFTSIAHTQ
jgi:hypothetical protein